MKKQSKSFMIFGLLVIVFITLWFATGEIQEGFKEGAKPMKRNTGPRAAPSARVRVAAAAPVPMKPKATISLQKVALKKTRR
jgi:hypothetical protein